MTGIMRALARIAVILALAAPLLTSSLAQEAEEEHATPHYPLEHPRHPGWSFGGPFGKYDPQ
jgi:ubiquinol-cytochrome c reductase cytochrome c1 subunit